jgi:hypothetical protein
MLFWLSEAKTKVVNSQKGLLGFRVWVDFHIRNTSSPVVVVVVVVG